jgi:hypothetical protein
VFIIFLLPLKDKIFTLSEKVYCVVDGCLMHCYKKPTDRKQIKSYKLTGILELLIRNSFWSFNYLLLSIGIKVKTVEDYKQEQQLSLGTKKAAKHLKHPRSFEVLWKNGKTYQVCLEILN